jgi:hypothetical protein
MRNRWRKSISQAFTSLAATPYAALVCEVPEEGLEPSWAEAHWILSPQKGVLGYSHDTPTAEIPKKNDSPMLFRPVAHGTPTAVLATLLATSGRTVE